MMDRRHVLLAAVAAVAAPRVDAQKPAPVKRVGILNYGHERDRNVAEFINGLAALGYVAGRNLDIRHVWAGGELHRLPQLADELLATSPDLILALGPAVWAVKPKTTTVPILIAFSGDPVGQGVVASLARSGNNLTGFSLMSSDLAAKRLEVLQQALPGATRIGVLYNPGEPATIIELRETEAAAQRLGVKLVPLATRTPADIDGAIAAAKQQTDGVVVFIHGFAVINRARLIEQAAAHGVPALYGWREFADAGGLLSYGPDARLLVKRAAILADKILRGTKPSDIPIEQPSRVELVVNLKTAKALGLTLPAATLLRADEVIE